MRTSRSILFTALGTVLSLLYVFQQTEIVKLGYKITSAQNVLEQCFDRKTSLEYTVFSLESPFNLDKSLLLQKDGFEMPQTYKLVKVGPAKNVAGARVKTARSASRTAGIRRLAFLSLFADKQAEAKTIK